MTVAGQKRKALGDPCTLCLETSGSNAATAYAADLQAQQKRRHCDQDNVSGAQEHPYAIQAQPFLGPPHGTMSYSMEQPLQRSSSRNDGSSLSGYGTAFDVGGSPQISTATARSRGWPSEYAPAGSFASSDSHQQSSIGDQHEVAMQAETPHSQAQEAPREFSFQPQGLQRSNSEPNMRLMLASPLNPLPQAVFQPAYPAFGSSTTAGALVPYKAPEEVIKDAHRSTQRREVERMILQMQASQAACDLPMERGEVDVTDAPSPQECEAAAMEVDESAQQS